MPPVESPPATPSSAALCGGTVSGEAAMGSPARIRLAAAWCVIKRRFGQSRRRVWHGKDLPPCLAKRCEVWRWPAAERNHAIHCSAVPPGLARRGQVRRSRLARFGSLLCSVECRRRVKPCLVADRRRVAGMNLVAVYGKVALYQAPPPCRMLGLSWCGVMFCRRELPSTVLSSRAARRCYVPLNLAAVPSCAIEFGHVVPLRGVRRASRTIAPSSYCRLAQSGDVTRCGIGPQMASSSNVMRSRHVMPSRILICRPATQCSGMLKRAAEYSGIPRCPVPPPCHAQSTSSQVTPSSAVARSCVKWS